MLKTRKIVCHSFSLHIIRGYILQLSFLLFKFFMVTPLSLLPLPINKRVSFDYNRKELIVKDLHTKVQ